MDKMLTKVTVISNSKVPTNHPGCLGTEAFLALRTFCFNKSWGCPVQHGEYSQ